MQTIFAFLLLTFLLACNDAGNTGGTTAAGEVHGALHKDTIKLWYDFHSEGMRSVMQVYFLKEGANLYRGIGDVATKGDTAYFTGKGAIRYMNDHAFEKVDCHTIDEKYKQPI